MQRIDTLDRMVIPTCGHFTHILHKVQKYIKSWTYIFHNIVDNNLCAKFA